MEISRRNRENVEKKMECLGNAKIKLKIRSEVQKMMQVKTVKKMEWRKRMREECWKKEKSKSVEKSLANR